MKAVVHRATDRGRGDYAWLSTRYSFSFANWYDPARMGFGALRVINDDRIAPMSGFGAHRHEDMEIITIVTHGAVTHEDSMGNSGRVSAGDVQVMSAGTGVTHAERNDSPNEELTLFQIWIATNAEGAEPRYEQKTFNLESKQPGLTLLVAPTDEEGALVIYQDAYLYQGVLDAQTPLTYSLKGAAHGAYVFVIEGEVTVAGQVLGARDAIGITDTDAFTIESHEAARLLIIDVPL